MVLPSYYLNSPDLTDLFGSDDEYRPKPILPPFDSNTSNQEQEQKHDQPGLDLPKAPEIDIGSENQDSVFGPPDPFSRRSVGLKGKKPKIVDASGGCGAGV